MIRYKVTGTARLAWTCNENDCNDCVGGYCSVLALTVCTEGGVPDLPPVSDCRYGDTVKLEKIPGDSGDTLTVREIAIIGKPGKLKYTVTCRVRYAWGRVPNFNQLFSRF